MAKPKQNIRTILTILIFSLALGLLLLSRPNAIPPHLLNHPVEYTDNIISQKAQEELVNIMKAHKIFNVNTADLKCYKANREHIGEARPIGEDGKCNHPFLLPGVLNSSECVLPGRVDIGRHFIKTGGVDGIKESYASLLSRILSFGVYKFNVSEYPVVEELFKEVKFRQLAEKVCPSGKQYLDPFQFNFIIQVPGQTVAAHVDGVYFWGATRKQFPQWLLAAMVFSGLWKDRFVDQVQVVGYLHNWKPSTEDSNGDFVYWGKQNDDGSIPYEVISPNPRAGSAVDGSKTVHAALVYRKNEKLPPFSKDNPPSLVYKGGDKWALQKSNGDILKEYNHDDLRISIVYRGKCFANESEAKRYEKIHNNDRNATSKDLMTLDEILNTFANDLYEKRKINDIEQALHLDRRLELAILIIETYIKYPFSPQAWIPYNYCALGRLIPWTQPLLNFIC